MPALVSLLPSPRCHSRGWAFNRSVFQVWVIANKVQGSHSLSQGTVCHRTGVQPLEPKGQGWDYGIGVSEPAGMAAGPGLPGHVVRAPRRARAWPGVGGRPGHSLRRPWAPASGRRASAPPPPAGPLMQLSLSGGLGPHLHPGQCHQGPQEHVPGDSWRAGPPQRALECGRCPAGGRGPRLLLSHLPCLAGSSEESAQPMSLRSE